MKHVAGATLFAAVLCTGPAAAADVRYKSGELSAGQSVIEDAENGSLYRIRLVPDYDVAGHAAVLTLVLSGMGAGDAGTNLLEPKRTWHGAEPFSFAAKDFTRGVTASVFGGKRALSIGDSSKILVVDIHRVTMAPCGEVCVAPSFKDLSMSVAFSAGK